MEFSDRYVVDEETGCWIWKNRPNDSGYGRLTVDGRRLRAHRYAYELLVGPIPGGLDLDHLCRVRNCVNPEHLEPVTRGENLRRGTSEHSGGKTHCKRGHEFTPENTYVTKAGYRNCRVCHRLYERVAKRLAREGTEVASIAALL